MSGNVHDAILVERREIARAIDELVFEVTDDDFRWRPGQFVSLRVGVDGDGASILRSYSIAGGSGRRFVLVVKRVPGGAAWTYLRELTVGATVHLTGPMGFFVLELKHAGDVVFGATGVGIAPIRPMIEEVLARNETSRVYLFWGSRLREELFWLDELASPRLTTRIFLSGSDTDGFEKGRITSAITSLPVERPTYYLVGSGAMIRDVKATLVAAGVDRKRQIRNEAFFD